MLTKAAIEAAAEQFGYKVTDAEPARGASYHISLRDERTDEKVIIEIWPDTDESGLIGLLSRAAILTRQVSVHYGTPSDWMM